MSVRPNVRSAKCPSAKCLSAKCPATVQKLDAVQRHALRLVDSREQQQPAHVTSLEHRTPAWRVGFGGLPQGPGAGDPTPRPVEIYSLPRQEVHQGCTHKRRAGGSASLALETTPADIHSQDSKAVEQVHSSHIWRTEHIHTQSESFCLQVAWHETRR